MKLTQIKTNDFIRNLHTCQGNRPHIHKENNFIRKTAENTAAPSKKHNLEPNVNQTIIRIWICICG